MNLMALFQKISPNTLILTANKRLSRFLTQHYQTYQRNLGCIAWESVSFIPLQTWLEQCWQRAQVSVPSPLTHPILLTSSQEMLLWSQVISDGDASSLASLASQAWHIAQAWKIPFDHPDFEQGTSSDSRHFLTWAKRFDTECQHNRWISKAVLPQAIERLALSNYLDCPHHIMLVGFLEIPPSIQSLIATLKTKNCKISLIQLSTDSFHVHKVRFPDTQSEIASMALWARQYIDEKLTYPVACIVPHLTTMRSEIEKIFLQVFPSKDYFNISMGTSLLSEPVIHIIFYLLRLVNEPLMINEISHIIRSPWIGKELDENSERALLEIQLREHNQWQYTIEELLSFAKKHSKCSCFQACLDRAITQFRLIQTQSKRTFYDWAITIHHLLDAFQWPGNRTLSSREYQAIEHLTLALDELTHLDLFQKKVSYTPFVNRLYQQVNYAIFQPKSEDAPIQILGVLEAEGLVFSRAWLMDLTDDNWPSLASPNPFLPLSLQKKFNTPHSSIGRESQFCQQTLHRMIQSSEYTILSYPKQKMDLVTRPSPLIMSYPTATLNDLGIPPFHSRNFHQRMNSTTQTTTLVDAKAPPISLEKKAPGGSRIFKLQALCPFRAFSELRLSAKSINPPSFSLSPLEKGSIAHEVLELIWKELKTHRKLSELNNENLSLMLRTKINAIFERWTAQKKWPASIISLEKKRLHQLLSKWLAVEKNRAPFEIYALEQWRLIKIANLTLSIKMDRIDRERDQTYTLIDYKTTHRVSPRDWDGDRPSDPQLPLYLISAQEPINTIAFAVIHSQQSGFRYMSSKKEALPGRNDLDKDPESKWKEHLSTWPVTLTKLAEDFQQGIAEVSPKSQHESCEKCHLKTLCRKEAWL